MDIKVDQNRKKLDRKIKEINFQDISRDNHDHAKTFFRARRGQNYCVILFLM
jgi:hypothetical protein